MTNSSPQWKEAVLKTVRNVGALKLAWVLQDKVGRGYAYMGDEYLQSTLGCSRGGIQKAFKCLEKAEAIIRHGNPNRRVYLAMAILCRCNLCVDTASVHTQGTPLCVHTRVTHTKRNTRSRPTRMTALADAKKSARLGNGSMTAREMMDTEPVDGPRPERESGDQGDGTPCEVSPHINGAAFVTHGIAVKTIH